MIKINLLMSQIYNHQFNLQKTKICYLKRKALRKKLNNCRIKWIKFKIIKKRKNLLKNKFKKKLRKLNNYLLILIINMIVMFKRILKKNNQKILSRWQIF